MTKQTTYICDLCQRKSDDAIQIFVPYKTHVDSPSGRTETDFKELDICVNCATRILNIHFGGMEPEEGRGWLIKRQLPVSP